MKTSTREALPELYNHPAIDEIAAEIDNIGEYVEKFSLADAIREGAACTNQAQTWESEGDVCALSSAMLSLRARGLL